MCGGVAEPGRRRPPRNRIGAQKVPRGFKSSPLRQFSSIVVVVPMDQERGGVTERPKVRHWKCRARVTPVPRVRIPAPPPELFGLAVLDGELAVPCNPQSASAGLNSLSRGDCVGGASRGGVEGWAPRNGNRRTPPGPEGSNGKATLSCAVGVPGRSRFRGEIAVRAVRRRVHGHCIGAWS